MKDLTQKITEILKGQIDEIGMVRNSLPPEGPLVEHSLERNTQAILKLFSEETQGFLNEAEHVWYTLGDSDMPINIWDFLKARAELSAPSIASLPAGSITQAIKDSLGREIDPTP